MAGPFVRGWRASPTSGREAGPGEACGCGDGPHAVSDSGEVVAFSSISANLDPQVRDTNKTDDAFVRIR